jgi:hypothetical protein
MKTNNNKYSVLDKPVLDKLDRDGPCQQKLKSLPCRQAGLFLNLFIICLAFLLTPATSVYGITQVTNTITVTATIGEPKLTLYGYTSPFAQVKLEGIGVARETQSNKEGYFYFDRVFLPSPYPELYLLTIDTDNRASSPVFLPSLPVGPYEISIGPVLMSPTITLGKGKYLPNEQVIASGQTTPLSEVNIYLANQNRENFWQKLFYLTPLSLLYPHQTYAYFIPKYQIKSDENGRFQFNLPINSQIAGLPWKVFAAVSFLDSPSPKSNTLNFTILNLWQWFLEVVGGFILAVFGLLRPYGLALLIVGEFLLILWLFRRNSAVGQSQLLRK